MNKVSIIIPIYNVERFLNKCIDSVINQSYRHLEIILVNDGSPDGSEKICLDYKRRDERIIYIKKENGGLSDARNVGIRQATGDYLMFVDSDDYLDIDTVKSMLNAAESTKADLVVAGLYVDYEKDGRLIQSISYTVESGTFKDKLTIAQKTILMKKNALIDSSCNKLYKTSLIRDNHVFMPQGELFEDIDFIYHLLPFVGVMHVMDKSFYHYIQRDIKRITNTYKKDKVNTLSERFYTMLDYYVPYSNQLGETEISEIRFWLIRYSFSCFMDLFSKSCAFSAHEKRKYINWVISNHRFKQNLLNIVKLQGWTHNFLWQLIKSGNVNRIYRVSQLMYFVRNNCGKIFAFLKAKGV